MIRAACFCLAALRIVLVRGVAILWASPASVLGLGIGLFGLLTGGRVKHHTGVLEFHGGLIGWLLSATPVDAMAITLGHTVLARNDVALEITREHERVHVRQYERWGPVFLPAYVFCSAILYWQGRDAYRENPFEVEAYRVSNPFNR